MELAMVVYTHLSKSYLVAVLDPITNGALEGKLIGQQCTPTHMQ